MTEQTKPQGLDITTSRHSLLLGVALLVPLALTGCNTVSGIGEDVEAAGGAIEESAEKNKKY